MVKSLVVFGTRPEAIKLAPVIRRLREERQRVHVCVTGQHRELLDQALEVFEIEPDDRLHTMRGAQTLAGSAGRILQGVASVIERRRPDVVIVQGDTTSTFSGALAAFYANTPVAHVEAGLRTGNRGQPFPEETHRVMAARLADLHFAATPGAASNLLVEGIPQDSILTTGNTAIDAVLDVSERIRSGELHAPDPPWLDRRKRLLLLTTHRRESFGPGFERICQAVTRLARRDDVQIVCPMHPNPNVRRVIAARLGGLENVFLSEPADYVQFIGLMLRSSIILTDSGGVQEEAPALGRPVLVLRETTERPEAIEVGATRLTGLDPETIIGETELLLDDEVEYLDRAQPRFPFGDGRAAERIVRALARFGQVARFVAAG